MFGGRSGSFNLKGMVTLRSVRRICDGHRPCEGFGSPRYSFTDLETTAVGVGREVRSDWILLSELQGSPQPVSREILACTLHCKSNRGEGSGAIWEPQD